MITKDMLNDIQAEFGKTANLISALAVVVAEVDDSAEGKRRRDLDALIGVSDAIADQMELAQNAFDALFVALRESKEAAA